MSRLALRAIGPLILAAIWLSIDRDRLFGVLSRADPGWLALAYLAPLPAIAMRTARWQILLGPAAAGWRFAELARVYAQSIAAGVVTPGRLGEFAKAATLARRGAGLAPALLATILDRLADMGFLALLGAGAWWLWVAPEQRGGWWVGLALGSLAAVPLLRAVAQSRAAAALRARLLARVGDEATRADAIAPLSTRAAGLCSGATAMSWGLTFAANVLFAESLGLPVGALEIVGISALCSLVASLPISIAGAGTRDAALIALLAPYGVERPEALALGVLMLSNTLFVGAVCALAFLGPSVSGGSAD